jgi:4-amino-4-deoxy-L-arabinose transferase-like glycosyltransferase
MNLSDPTNLLIAGTYYVITGFLIFFSIFGVYILIRYGKSSLLAFSVSVFYVFIFLVILSGSYQTLQALLQ